MPERSPILRERRFVRPPAARLILVLVACNGVQDDYRAPDPPPVIFREVTLNPTGYSPLAAAVKITSSAPVMAGVRVVGKNGPASDVVHDFQAAETSQVIPVLGLYAGHANVVELTYRDAGGRVVGTSVDTVRTDSLVSGLPAIRIDSSSPGRKPGMTLVGYMGNPTLDVPFIFDEFGDIRWFLYFQSVSDPLTNLQYDNGPARLRNGNLYFGDVVTNRIYEADMLGTVVNSWPLAGYRFHHNVLEKPDGNFLLTATKLGESTIEDQVIELDRNSGQILRSWDLRQSLQAGRRAWSASASDWFHGNSVEFDESDGGIIVSGRHQGVVKLDTGNNVIWIMAPHRDWGPAGNGVDLRTRLLQPLDAGGRPITDTAVLSGSAGHPDFEWNMFQHAAKTMPNGDLSLFDNGNNRNIPSSQWYSRAVTYRVDPVNRTVRQLWQYGKERGRETFSPVLSDVDYHPGVNHIVFSPGAPTPCGKEIEVDYGSSRVIFEATICQPAGEISSFHRTERLSLYP